jgi:hypothetical protein
MMSFTPIDAAPEALRYHYQGIMPSFCRFHEYHTALVRDRFLRVAQTTITAMPPRDPSFDATNEPNYDGCSFTLEFNDTNNYRGSLRPRQEYLRADGKNWGPAIDWLF